MEIKKNTAKKTFNRFGEKKTIFFSIDSAADASVIGSYYSRKVAEMDYAMYMAFQDGAINPNFGQ